MASTFFKLAGGLSLLVSATLVQGQDIQERTIRFGHLNNTDHPTSWGVKKFAELVHAKSICRLLQATGLDCPLFAIVTEGGLAAMSAEWGADDVILHTAGPAEVEARIRLAIGRRAAAAVADAPDEIRSGELAIDEATYAARLRGRVLDLTFKEFELLKFLAQHPGRVFTRAQLLQEVWGYDYFGGTRTVDVHVRRLRAKLGPEHDALIGTVRNVGYRFVPVKGDRATADGRARGVRDHTAVTTQ